MKWLLAIALLLPAPAMAQTPSPAQVGITSAVPNVVQVYDSSHNWATIGTIDPATHVFTVSGPAGIPDAPDATLYGRKVGAWAHITHNDITDWTASLPAPYTLPTASTTVLGGVKVDGTTITATGGGVISGTPAGITANSTVTSGFSAGQLLTSDGSKVQPSTYGFSTGSGGTAGQLLQLYPTYNGAAFAYNGIYAMSFSQFGQTMVSLPLNVGLGWWDNVDAYTSGPANHMQFGLYAAQYGNWGVLEQRPGVGYGGTPQAYQIYNTFTDDNNGEWGGFDWKSSPNTLRIGTFNNGTGQPRGIQIYDGFYGPRIDIDASAPGWININASSNISGNLLVGNNVNAANLVQATGGYTANGVTGVSCTAGSTVTATLGIVTACGSGGGTPSFPQTVAGTTNSGGIPYFSDATHLSSSAALAANALVVGGGAGVAPSTITTGAGVNTVLGVAPNTNGGIDTSTTSSVVVGAIETGGGSGVAGVGLADVATGSYLRSGGVTTIPAWQAFGTGAQTAVNTAINTTGGLVTQSGTLAASALLLGGGSATAITSTTTGTGVVTALGVNTGSTGAMVLQTAPGVTQAGFVSNGTQPTITGSGGTCATTTKVGGATAGTVVLSAVCASTNTIVWTSMPTAPNGWACDAVDRTTRTAGPFIESAATTTGFTLTVGSTSSVAADVLQWKCQGY